MSAIFDIGRQVYRRIVECGESLDRVERELISAADHLSDEQKAGLWLYAWSLQSAAHQRYQARQFLRQLEQAEEG